MRHRLYVLIIVLAVGLLAGCSLIQTGFSQVEEDESVVEDEQEAEIPLPEQETVDAVETAPLPEVDPAELYTRAQEMYIHGVEQTQAGEFDQALDTFNEIMRLLLQPYNRETDSEMTRRLDSLYFEVCLAQVRVGRLTGRYAPVIIKKKLIGIDFHPRVEKWIQYFTVNGREGMQRYLSRSTRYVPLFRQILKEEGLPEDLVYLPLIESGFSAYAYSPAHASGIWQFIKTTGKNYGLTINAWVDERRDPVKATRAAARYLKDLYNNFGDWALALAGYNCGENRVAGAMRSAGHNDFWRLRLPSETMDYVPKYFASVIIARDPEAFGLYVAPETPLEIKQYELQGVVELKKFAELIGIPYEELKALNPEILGSYTPPIIPKYKINVPANKYDEIAKVITELPDTAVYLSAAQVAKLKNPPKPRSRFVYYKVKRGDTLGGIAHRYRTTVTMIKRYNPQARGRFIRPGMKLKIPVGRKR